MSIASCLGLLGAAAVVSLLAACAAPVAGPAGEVFFDDFQQDRVEDLQRDGWQLRTKAGHPGIPGARWDATDAVSLVDDSQVPGNRLLRLRARTDGTPEGTSQAQVCHARKYLAGTYAARVRFSDAPTHGPDGDVVVQTFYSVGPLRFDFDPEYSELDWEYLPNGGWGDARPRLYGVSWQTVRIEPWTAYNQPVERFGQLGGWHVLVMQVADGRSRFFLDGELLAEHGGRNHPAVPMAINFNLWFSPGGQLPGVRTPRVYQQDVDWVYHARNIVQTPAEVAAAVRGLRRQGKGFVDAVPAPIPALSSPCDF